ncbi:MAG: hypothetical protein GY928_39285 [Colwellia sp.]|nr:hypothetical protein [Colwellia sp.]
MYPRLHLKPSSLFLLILFFNMLVFLTVFFFIESKEMVNVNGMFFTSMILDFDRNNIFPIVLVFLFLGTIGSVSYIKSPTSTSLNITLPPLTTKKITTGSQDMVMLIFLFLLSIFSILHFSAIDFGTFWFNYDYQIIKTPEEISRGSGSLFRIYHFIFRIISLFVAVILIYYMKNFSLPHITLSLFVFLYGFLFLYVAESRWIIIYMCVLFLSRIMMFNSKPKVLEGFFWFICFVFLFVKVIFARNYGLYGLSVQVDIFIEVLSLDILSIFQGLLINLGDGFLGLANVVQNDYWYPLQYKLLSFSPFPSFIDGFASIQHYENRISYHVPFNAVSEAYAFGSGYFIFYLLIIFLFLYSSDLVYSKAGVLYKSILLAVVLWNVFYMFGYPLRNVMRMFEYFTILNYFMFLKNKTSQI